MPRMAYVLAKQAASLPYPERDILFLADEVYRWMGLDELGATAFYTHDFQVGYYACKKLIEDGYFPETEKERIHANLQQYELKLREIQSQQMEMDAAKQQQIQEQEKDRKKRIKNRQNLKNKKKKKK